MEKINRRDITFHRDVLIWVKHNSHLTSERVRADILLAHEAGLDRQTIQEIVGCSPATISCTIRGFSWLGCWTVVDLRRLGNARKDGRDRVIDLLPKIVEKQPRDFGWMRSRWSTKLVAEEVVDQTDIRYSAGHLRRLLHESGCRPCRPKPTIRRQPHDWRAQMRKLMYDLSDLPDGDIILYSDEMKVELNPKSGPDWTAPGQRKSLVTPGGNRRWYTAGAYNPMTGHLVIVDGPKNNTDLFVALCNELARRYRGWVLPSTINDGKSGSLSEGKVRRKSQAQK